MPRRFSGRCFAQLRNLRSVPPPSSRRRPGPIAPGLDECRRHLLHCLNVSPRRMGPGARPGRRLDINPHSRDTMRPSFANSFALKKQRGRREDRVRAAPAVSCAKVANKNTHEHTGSAETLRPSLRNGFTAYSVLSPARPGLLVTVVPERRELPRNLTPAIGASGPHDFAVRDRLRSSFANSASTASHRAFRDVRNAPLVG